MTVHAVADPAADPAAAPLTFYDVIFELNQRRAAVRAEIDELRAGGEAVVVPADALFLCELAGLVVDLRTGVVVGSAVDFVTLARWVQAFVPPLPAATQDAVPLAD